MRDLIIYVVLPLVGICLIVFALGWGKSLTRQPVEFSFDRLGLSLKADALMVVILLGFIMAGTGAFFLYQGYESKLAVLHQDLDAMQNKVDQIRDTINDAMKSLKQYDLRLNLVFPSGEQPENPWTVNVNAYVRKNDQKVDKPYDLRQVERGAGGICVEVSKLNVGDMLYVTVEEGDKRWRSDDLVTPSAHLKMNRIPQ